MNPRRCLAAVPARAARVTRVAARAHGFVLVVAMVMLAVIGLVSAAVLRNAVGGEQVADGGRLQTQALQYAQLALRLCEAQLALPAEARTVAPLPAADPPAWTALRSWTSADAGAAHALTPDEIGDTLPPGVAPQCLLEATAAPQVYTVTARGFSADFKSDPTTGATRTGAAVWLQTTLLADGGPSGADAAPAAPLVVRRRLWQQLLTPPF